MKDSKDNSDKKTNKSKRNSISKKTIYWATARNTEIRWQFFHPLTTDTVRQRARHVYLSHLSPTYPGRHASHTKSSPWVAGMHVGLKLNDTINKFVNMTAKTYHWLDVISAYSTNTPGINSLTKQSNKFSYRLTSLVSVLQHKLTS